MNVYRTAPPWTRPGFSVRRLFVSFADEYADFLRRREEAREFGMDFREPPPVPLPPRPANMPE